MLVIVTISTIDHVHTYNTVFNHGDLIIGNSNYGHSPINITSNVEFTSLNGVSEGSGTVDDPYIIKNWCINASTVHAIWIENTDAYFIIRNCYVYGGGVNSSCIFLYNVQNGRIENSTVTRSWYGIYLYSSSHNTLANNSVYGNDGDGICLDSSSNNTLIDNAVYENNDGIELDSLSHHNIITNNTIYTNHIGIFLKSSSNNTLTNNAVYENNWDGIRLSNSSNNILTANTIHGNSNNNGIGLFSSSNNTITDNRIYGNDNGIYLISSSCNLIYHNNLINNTQNGYDETPANNYWYHPILLEGNYWSDYSGLDDGSGVGKHSIAGDGIGDTEYAIDGNNTDHYPLMGMFYDFNATSEYHVQTICNSSISSFQYNGTAISFYVAGDNGTTGFCRICIPTALMNVTYKVFINGTEVSYNLLPCSNETYSYLYFNYTHSTQEVIIIPEFPSFPILSLFMIATILAVAIYRKKRFGTSRG